MVGASVLSTGQPVQDKADALSLSAVRHGYCAPQEFGGIFTAWYESKAGGEDMDSSKPTENGTVSKAAMQQYGGQAVIEGVMMRSPRYFAVACRRPDGTIVVQREEVDKSILGKLKWL